MGWTPGWREERRQLGLDRTSPPRMRPVRWAISATVVIEDRNAPTDRVQYFDRVTHRHYSDVNAAVDQLMHDIRQWLIENEISDEAVLDYELHISPHYGNITPESHHATSMAVDNTEPSS